MTIWQFQNPPAVRRQAPENPKPLGTLSATGATAQVLFILSEAPQRYWSYREIAKRLPQPKSLSWALRHAQLLGWIERAEDHRSSRYLRYRITELGAQVFG
ncbi:MarR family transcriptional regulator [Lampropedia aestuarii]|uniref:MarR family transcriptional regulator n=1 Tax=Lampropedia aestuarii TaxID=2562762 RepID=A0A4S5BIX9_9BURK|nr:MarR family transcriptional regulator [Lampropedia aestuarii]THJ32394.1 MarR family transcriptional regulator [Lampropedia aestuarii]